MIPAASSQCSLRWLLPPIPELLFLCRPVLPILSSSPCSVSSLVGQPVVCLCACVGIAVRNGPTLGNENNVRWTLLCLCLSMLRVPIAALVVPAAVVVRPLRGEAFFDSCRKDPVAPGGHLAICGLLGCLVIVGGRDSRSDDSHLPCRNPRNDSNCHFGGSCCHGLRKSSSRR